MRNEYNNTAKDRKNKINKLKLPGTAQEESCNGTDYTGDCINLNTGLPEDQHEV